MAYRTLLILGAWTQLQPEKRDALVALAMDEIAMFLVDEASREAARKTLTELAESRLRSLDLKRGRLAGRKRRNRSTECRRGAGRKTGYLVDGARSPRKHCDFVSIAR